MQPDPNTVIATLWKIFIIKKVLFVCGFCVGFFWRGRREKVVDYAPILIVCSIFLSDLLNEPLFGFWLKIDKMVVERKQYIQIKVLPKFM